MLSIITANTTDSTASCLQLSLSNYLMSGLICQVTIGGGCGGPDTAALAALSLPLTISSSLAASSCIASRSSLNCDAVAERNARSSSRALGAHQPPHQVSTLVGGRRCSI